MASIQSLISRIVPEMIDLFEKRYTILRTVYAHQPVGRRMLAGLLGMGEHVVRAEITVLKNAGLIDIKAAGMAITSDGEDILDCLREYANELKGFSGLEQKVADLLGISRVIIVPGDLDENPDVLPIIGKAAAVLLADIVTNGSRIALTGGSSVAAAVNAFQKNRALTDILVLPARGGIGKEVEHQSNTLAALFAKKLGGDYRLLHLPDLLTQDAADTLLRDPQTRSVINEVKSADILVCGIGRAREMAIRRNLPEDQIDALEKAGAVAEAFGYYFNRRGDIVFTTGSIGLHISDLKTIPRVVGVAGGRQKAEALIAVLTGWRNCTLITDESAAAEIVRLVR